MVLKAFAKPIGKGLWWDGYEREEVVVIDEFRGQYPLSDMLQLLDPYKLQVECNGGPSLVRAKDSHLINKRSSSGLVL